MTRRTSIITFLTLFFGFTFLAQPAIAAECARMLGCMPDHSTNHLPGAKDDPSCTCTQSTQLLLRYICMPQNRSQIAPDMNLSSNIDDVLASQHVLGWLSQIWIDTADRCIAAVDPTPRNPIFILNQSFLC